MTEAPALAQLLGLPRDRPARVLALGAHADDIEIGCGGTVARLLEACPDARLSWVVLSGSDERAAEARASAAALLGERPDRPVITLDGRDGYLPYDPRALKEQVMALKAEGEPDLVLTHRLEDLHQDHRFAAELAWQAFRHSRIVEFEIPKYEGDLGRPNLYVTLPRVTCEAKVDGLLAHFPSQRAHDWFTAETFWALLRLRGVECRSPSGYAEGFTCRKLVA